MPSARLLPLSSLIKSKSSFKLVLKRPSMRELDKKSKRTCVLTSLVHLKKSLLFKEVMLGPRLSSLEVNLFSP